MPRPQRSRKICKEPVYAQFSPDAVQNAQIVELTVDEFEVVRLVDLEKMTHEQCAERMEISRTTVTEIYQGAREKIADCLVNGKRLVISGGNYRLCKGKKRGCTCGCVNCKCGCERQNT